MELLSEIFNERVILRNAIATVVLLVVLFLLRSLAIRSVRKVDWASEQVQLRRTDQIRWSSMLLLVFGIVFVWASEIKTLAISVVAIAVAFPWQNPFLERFGGRYSENVWITLSYSTIIIYVEL